MGVGVWKYKWQGTALWSQQNLVMGFKCSFLSCTLLVKVQFLCYSTCVALMITSHSKPDKKDMWYARIIQNKQSWKLKSLPKGGTRLTLTNISFKSSSSTSPPLALLMHAAHLIQPNTMSIRLCHDSRRAEENCKATFLSHQEPPDYLGHTSIPLGKLP
jgi:hypothetical protein